ncbi:abscisic acid 8'-hydroxylase 4-like isoform X1 [Rosa rugosa]|uniref:abscisic acid 8'-hydroxylase 4-like isoform X1 n=1 Tax=Rosa rugosa TaxID=74645 RepID=UPI002B408519|nr:abscisic acid 8'-hydroxylase 4-like isoform X1 [Rosa rugosa]
MNTVLLYCFVFALLSFILLGKQTRNKPRAKLPPGSMGWPYLGETLQLYSQNPNVFFGTRQQRYGEIFKTHILGSPGVMLCSPEAIRFVLVTQAHLFKPTYPKSKEKLIGPSALFFHQDDYHTQMRRLVQESLSLDAIKNLVPDIEAIAISTLDSWSGGQIVNTFYELKKFTFDVAALFIFGRLNTHYKEQLKKNYFTLDKGYNCFPINLPGSSYNKSVLARRRLSLILGEIIKERKENKLVEKDLLGSLLKFKDEQGQTLTHNQILDNIIGVLFAAQDTTATLLTWILKYMHDYSELLEAIQVEQKAIFAANEGGNQSLSWAQTRNMPLTSRAIKESLRMASIISFTFREAVEDVEYKGYLIRKGWKVLPLFRNIHHNPDFFNEPHNFNPSRFELGIRPNTFVPFGNGVHTCPGNEVAKTEILIFIYHLVNKFRWEAAASDGGIHYDPFPVPQQGLPAKFWKEYSGSQGALYDKRAN